MGALISYRNTADAATLTSSVGALAGYPLANLQTRQLAQVCRLSSGGGSATITANLGATRATGIVALMGINAAAYNAGAVFVQYSANGTTWTTATAAIASDNGAPDLPRCIIMRVLKPLSPEKVSSAWIRVTCGWTRINNAPYYEIGRLWIGDTLDIPEGCDSGWRLGYRDRGNLDSSAGEQAYTDPRIRVRQLSMSFSGVPTELAYGMAETGLAVPADVPSFQDLQMAAGRIGEVIAVPRAESPLWVRRAGIYGHLEREFEIEHQAGPNYAASLVVTEER